jgi:ABC-type glycerol-3-phosphate transport system substrate-binding protein
MRVATRRRWLKTAGRYLLAGGLASMAAPRLARGAASSSTLNLTWWGELEGSGLTRWIDDTIARFSAETGVRVNARLLDTEEIAEDFTRAAEAGQPVPDAQFFWSGLFMMESVWRGFLRPLNGLVSHSVLKRGGTHHSSFEGNQFRIGFYAEGFGMAYNKRLFDRAGLDADNPPTTWDGFLNACDRLRASGTVPIIGGVNDGFWGDWYLTNALPQQLDSAREALQLFIGNLDWRQPRYHDHWVRLEELSRYGFFNTDITELGMFDGLRLFDSGNAGFTLGITAALPRQQQLLGKGNVGFIVMPVFGKGKMAGQPIIDRQGWGIPSRAADPNTAARFLEFMHSKDRLQAMWTLSQQIPADEAFDASIIDDPLMRSAFDRFFGSGRHVLTVEDLMPVQFWTDAMFVASQKIVAGTMTGEQAGELAHRVTEAWRSTVSPETVNNYAIWGNSLEES